MAFLKLCALLAVLTLSCEAACPKLESWNRRPESSPVRQGQASRVMVRDRPGYYCDSISSCPTTLQDLQIDDIRDNNYNDIDCSVVVGGDGYVYIGAGYEAQTNSFPDSLVICVLQDKNGFEFPDKYQKQAITDVIQCAKDESQLSSSYTVTTPRDLNPASVEPMQTLYEWVQTLDNYQKQASGISG